MPARVLNLVVVVDGEFRGEIENRLERVGRYHPSRLVICAVAARAHDDRRVGQRRRRGRPRGRSRSAREQVELDIGERHLQGARHDRRPAARPRPRDASCGRRTATPRRSTRCGGWCRSCSSTRRTSPTCRRRSSARDELLESAYVVDLAWLRSTPWRERVAAAFDPPPLRRGLGEISEVTVRHRADSVAAGAAVLRLAVLAPGLAARARSRTAAASAARRPRPRAPRRGHAAPRARSSSRARPGSRASRSRWPRAARCRSTAGPGGLKSVRRARDGKRAGVDGAGRLARRGAGSSARACARRCCATRPTSRRCRRRVRWSREAG